MIHFELIFACGVLVAQSHLTLCSPIDLAGSSVCGILQAPIWRIVHGFPLSVEFSTQSFKWCGRVSIHCFVCKSELLVVQLCPALCDPMDCSPQAPLSMDFSRQEYWSGLPFPSSGHLPHIGMDPGSPALQADSLSSEQPKKLYI